MTSPREHHKRIRILCLFHIRGRTGKTKRRR